MFLSRRLQKRCSIILCKTCQICSLGTAYLGYGAALAFVPLEVLLLDVVALGAPLPVVHHHGHAELLLDVAHAVRED